MSIFKKIMTAVRGGATEVGEAIVDANGTRIFEQETDPSRGWTSLKNNHRLNRPRK